MIIDFHAHYLAEEHLHMHEKTATGHVVGATLSAETRQLILAGHQSLLTEGVLS